MQKVLINIEELKTIMKLMQETNAYSVEIVQDASNGIGANITAKIPFILGEFQGSFMLDVTDYATW